MRKEAFIRNSGVLSKGQHIENNHSAARRQVGTEHRLWTRKPKRWGQQLEIKDVCEILPVDLLVFLATLPFTKRGSRSLDSPCYVWGGTVWKGYQIGR